MKTTLPLVAAGLLLAPLAFAAPNTTTPQDNHFSWSYGEVGITSHDYDGPRDNLTSLDGNLSYALDQNLYALGGLSYGRTHGVNIWDLHGGLGFHTPLVKNLDVFGEGEINLDRASGDGEHDNETGYTLRAGVRARANDKVELKGGIYHLDIYDDDTGLFGSALYHLNQQTALGANLTLGDNETAFGLSARFNF